MFPAVMFPSAMFPRGMFPGAVAIVLPETGVSVGAGPFPLAMFPDAMFPGAMFPHGGSVIVQTFRAAKLEIQLVDRGDIRLVWHDGAADVLIAGNDLAQDDGLETAIIISLGTDRRAEDWEVLPDGHTDRRGWWGDVVAPAVDGDRIGSKLWLLSREKELPRVLPLAKQYAEESLEWLIQDKVATKVTVEASFVARGVLGLAVEIKRPDVDPVQYRYNLVWTGQEPR